MLQMSAEMLHLYTAVSIPDVASSSKSYQRKCTLYLASLSYAMACSDAQAVCLDLRSRCIFVCVYICTLNSLSTAD